MKTKQQIAKEINALVADEFEIDEDIITPEATIFKTLELDSISLVDLVSIVHTNYGISIAKEDLPALQTFDNLYDYIFARQK